MKGSKRRTLFLMLVAFFAGAISMLVFLAPGQINFQELLDENKRSRIADFDQASVKLERFGDWAWSRIKNNHNTDQTLYPNP